MSPLLRRFCFLLPLAALLLSGCSGSSSGSPTPTTSSTTQSTTQTTTLTSYTVSGTVRYEDVEYAQSGWTGKTVYKPVRNALVDLLSSDGTLQSTVTSDSNGSFLFDKVMLTAAPATVRVMAESDPVSGASVTVRNLAGAGYSATLSLAGLDLNSPVSINISQTSGLGGVFNMLDIYESAFEFVASHPSAPTLPPLYVYWKNSYTYTCSVAQSCPQGAGIYVLNGNGDQDEYDDDVLWHEFTHFVEYSINATDSPGGTHTFFMNTLDLRLAWSEGHADYFETAIKRWLHANHPERLSIPAIFPVSWYIDTDYTGAILLGLDMANPDTSLCVINGGGSGDCYIHASNEVAIAKILWTSSSVFTENATWNSFATYLPTVKYSQRNLEPFWDGLLMQAGVTEGAAALNFTDRQVNYVKDTSEPDDTTAARSVIDCTATGTCVNENHTLYNGSMVSDADIVPISVASGKSYTITTSGLTNGADTYLELLDSDGTTVLASNDDQTGCGDPGQTPCSNDGSMLSSGITYSATSNTTLYVRVTSASYATRWVGAGAYGGYTLTVSAQ